MNAAPSKSRPLPPLNAVRAFETAARHGSFKAAAAELGVTHGAVSRQIHLLEEWLGPPALFRRLSHGVALTAEGTALLVEVGPALDRIAAAGAVHGRPAERVTAVLRVNALATFSLRWLLPKLSLLRADHPEIESNDIPLGRLGQPDDIARVVSFLASPESGWISGQVIKANGGRN